MPSLSQVKKIVAFLRENPGQKFSSREIAEAIIAAYPDDYREKRSNPRFSSDAEFLSQVVAEIGAQKNSLLKQEPKICFRDKPRPRVFWYETEEESDSSADRALSSAIAEAEEREALSEKELYPLLVEYLQTEKNLYCQRIDEKRSKNQRGRGGNHWLYPDVVAMQPLDKSWDALIRDCLDRTTCVRLWSFEVKKELKISNVRECFFQAVSNSSWANEGYLVAIEISNGAEDELRMLSALHGIGVIQLNPDNIVESDILLPARSNIEINWQSANRILQENRDFKDFIDLVSTYHKTGRIRERDWNRV